MFLSICVEICTTWLKYCLAFAFAPRRNGSSSTWKMQMLFQGIVSLVSADGLHQLHIFVFFLAVFHVTFSAITMSLGRAKTRIWKEWENDTSSITYEFSSDPLKFRLTHQTSFVRQHASCWSKSTIMLYVVHRFTMLPPSSVE